tara:strand:- start:438 stop:1157 length:720 start_codon:yes stop_codon:yes gene_type:complete
MIGKDFTFIIPAAGRSRRFCNKKSKIFYSYKKKILLEHVINKFKKITKKIIIISNKKNLKDLKIFLKDKKIEYIKIIIQKKPTGMGHAVNLALKKVRTKFSAVIWADQIYLKNETILNTIRLFLKKKSLITFPVFNKKNPYALILRDKNNKFSDIIQSREVNKKFRYGESDCGFFVFKTIIVKKKLNDLIKKKMIVTKKTKEIDFISSFKYLKKYGDVNIIKAKNVKETVGINSKKNLL